MCPQNLQPSKMTEHVPSQLLSTQLLYIVTIISKGKKAWTCQGRMFSPDAVQILGFCRSPTNLHTYRDKSLDFDSILSNFETFRIDKNLQSSRFPTPYSSIALCHLRKIDNTWDPLNNTSLTSKLCRLFVQRLIPHVFFNDWCCPDCYWKDQNFPIYTPFIYMMRRC